jgi:hypothetical protein
MYCWWCASLALMKAMKPQYRWSCADTVDSPPHASSTSTTYHPNTELNLTFGVNYVIIKREGIRYKNTFLLLLLAYIIAPQPQGALASLAMVKSRIWVNVKFEVNLTRTLLLLDCG